MRFSRRSVNSRPMTDANCRASRAPFSSRSMRARITSCRLFGTASAFVTPAASALATSSMNNGLPSALSVIGAMRSDERSAACSVDPASSLRAPASRSPRMIRCAFGRSPDGCMYPGRNVRIIRTCDAATASAHTRKASSLLLSAQCRSSTTTTRGATRERSMISMRSASRIPARRSTGSMFSTAASPGSTCRRNFRYGASFCASGVHDATSSSTRAMIVPSSSASVMPKPDLHELDDGQVRDVLAVGDAVRLAPDHVVAQRAVELEEQP